jgi:hypothetical protein
MKITITIELGNAAMQTLDDVAASVNDCTCTVSDSTEPLRPGQEGKLWDVNGNVVGRFEVTA